MLPEKIKIIEIENPYNNEYLELAINEILEDKKIKYSYKLKWILNTTKKEDKGGTFGSSTIDVILLVFMRY